MCEWEWACICDIEFIPFKVDTCFIYLFFGLWEIFYDFVQSLEEEQQQNIHFHMWNRSGAHLWRWHLVKRNLICTRAKTDKWKFCWKFTIFVRACVCVPTVGAKMVAFNRKLNSFQSMKICRVTCQFHKRYEKKFTLCKMFLHIIKCAYMSVWIQASKSVFFCACVCVDVWYGCSCVCFWDIVKVCVNIRIQACMHGTWTCVIMKIWPFLWFFCLAGLAVEHVWVFHFLSSLHPHSPISWHTIHSIQTYTMDTLSTLIGTINISYWIVLYFSCLELVFRFSCNATATAKDLKTNLR